MHIDINQFFAAATCLLEPELKNKPLIIAGDSRRGIVSTASYEARKYGIHSAMPTYQAKQLCPHVVIRPSNFEWYHKKSTEFFDYIKKNYTDQIEIVSVDECYCDMTELMKDVKDPIEYLTKLQNDIYHNTGLQTSIGLATTKFLAKMGSDYKKPMGITIIRKRDIQKILYPLPIKDFYGIGKKTVVKLNDIGIYTIGDFAINESYELKKILGKFYDVSKKWIVGEGDDVVQVEPDDPKSISSSTTFLYDTNDYEDIRSMIELKSREVSNQAKIEHKIGKTITLIMKDSDFKSITRSITIKKATCDFTDIYTNALSLYEKEDNRKLIRLIGVGLSQLIDKDDFYVQISLFDQEKNQKECRTQLLVSKLNRKANKELFTIASKKKKEKE